jgi:hypothetical protein
VSPDIWQVTEYLDLFTEWMQKNSLHSISGLEQFTSRAYSIGTTDSIAAFIHRHCKNRRIRFSQGEFIISKIVSNNCNADWSYLENDKLSENDAVVVSLPFSGNGNRYPKYNQLIEECNRLKIPVLLDLAYFGISHGIHFDLTHPCITDVVCSLSKPMNVQLRLGIRFTRDHHDDHIQTSSDLKIFNRIAVQIGVELLKKFPAEYIISKYLDKAMQVCNRNKLATTETITLGLGNPVDHPDFFRSGFYRVCITDNLML